MDLSSLQSSYRCKSSVLSVYAFLHAYEEEQLELDAPYQRDYVWGEKEQQALLESFFSGRPLNSIAITTSNSSAKHMIVVDGKQRLTTLLLFFNNKIPFLFDGKEVFARDLDKAYVRTVTKQTLPVCEIFNHDGSDVTLLDQVDFFLRTNFFGVPQSREHHEAVLDLKRSLLV